MVVLLVVSFVLGVLYYSSYTQHSQYLDLQYWYCSYSQHAQYLGHHILEYCDTLSTSSIQSIEPRNTSGTGCLRKKVSNTIHTNLYHEEASCTDIPTYSSINSSIWSTRIVVVVLSRRVKKANRCVACVTAWALLTLRERVA